VIAVELYDGAIKMSNGESAQKVSPTLAINENPLRRTPSVYDQIAVDPTRAEFCGLKSRGAKLPSTRLGARTQAASKNGRVCSAQLDARLW
jgi:hypothetical protein